MNLYFSKFGVFVLKLYVQVNFWFLRYNWTVFNALEHASFVHSVHASYRLIFSIVVFSLTLSDAVCPYFSLFSFFGFCFGHSFPTLSIMVRKSRAHKKTSTSSTPVFQSDKFLSPKNQETFEKLNVSRKVWVERKVILDEVDHEICRSFYRGGWLPLLDVDNPPPTVLIREFYSNLSIHSTSSNIQFVKSWIKGEEYVSLLLK